MPTSKEIITNNETPQPILGLVIMGFLVFSPFSSILVMDYLGFPLSLPELLFLPFLFIFRKRYYFSSIGIIRTSIFILLWIFMIIISIIANNYSISAILSSSRTYLTLIIAYLIFSKKNNVSLDDIMYISLGSTIGWLYSSIYGVNLYLEGQSEVVSRCGNMLAIPLVISIALFRKHNKILFLSIILCIAISLTAGMRRQILVFFISIFLAYSFYSLKNINRFIIQSIMMVIIVVIFMIFFPVIKGYTKENIPGLYYRVFQKTEMFFSGKKNTSGDSIRLDNMRELTENFSNYIIPKGFVSRRTDKDSTGKFIDFPLAELFYMFGLIFAILILFIIGVYTIGCYFQYFIKRDDSIVFVILSLIMFMLLFLEGTFLSSSYVAPVTGYCLGRLKYHSRMVFFKSVKVN